MRSLPLVIILLALQPALAFAQNDTDHEDHRFVYEVGWSGEQSKAEGFNGKGLSTGIEITPIENWLAIETSVGIHHGQDGNEMPIEVAFRKPWNLSPSVEFMAGVGPQLIHVFRPESETFGGVSTSAHFMVWPRKNVGWYAEIEYDWTFPRDGMQQGAGFAVGLLIGR